jgi:hypothetical protein
VTPAAAPTSAVVQRCRAPWLHSADPRGIGRSHERPLDTTTVTDQLPHRAGAPTGSLPFDAAAARADGRVYAAARAHERKPRGARAVDVLIAATALANDLPLLTRDPDDLNHLGAVGLMTHALER